MTARRVNLPLLFSRGHAVAIYSDRIAYEQSRGNRENPAAGRLRINSNYRAAPNAANE